MTDPIVILEQRLGDSEQWRLVSREPHDEAARYLSYLRNWRRGGPSPEEVGEYRIIDSDTGEILQECVVSEWHRDPVMSDTDRSGRPYWRSI